MNGPRTALISRARLDWYRVGGSGNGKPLNRRTTIQGHTLRAGISDFTGHSNSGIR